MYDKAPAVTPGRFNRSSPHNAVFYDLGVIIRLSSDQRTATA